MSSIVKILNPFLNMIPEDSLHDVIMQQIINVAKKRNEGEYWATPNEFVNKLHGNKDFDAILERAKISDDDIRSELEKL